ncbi:MAG TPA: FAD-dependent oxidoreductase [Actinomycetes bacterium]|nr:FAD-dependent oxidoreductase [Actinomycetes bacterium]
MRVVVVGLGAMGLPAAAELARRGHDVVAVDRGDIGNRRASSSGATRIYRLAHAEPGWVRMAIWNHELWDRLERDVGRPLRWRRGLIWSRGSDADVAKALASEGVEHEVLDRERQAELFPELRWDPERTPVWQPDAGAIMADQALAAVREVLQRSGGRLVTSATVLDIVPTASGVDVTWERDGERGRHTADRVVLAAGPWAQPMLADLGVGVSLTPYLEQVTYVRGGDAVPWADRPCLIQPPADSSSFGFYSMPTPGIGYKIGIDDTIGRFDADDPDRTPVESRELEAVDRIRLELPSFDSTALWSEVCAWTDSPDGHFVIDRVGDVIFGCGDSGQGFKFLPMFGQVFADLVEDRPLPDAVAADVAALDMTRFGHSFRHAESVR